LMTARWWRRSRATLYLADCVQQPGPSSDTVEEILGRPALTFAEWAGEHSADFRN